MIAGNGNTPVYQQIEMLHANKIAEHLASGKPLKEYKNPWRQSLMVEVWVQSPKSLAKLDPKLKRGPQMVLDEIHEHVKLFYDYEPS
jgi:hypothetical protein